VLDPCLGRGGYHSLCMAGSPPALIALLPQATLIALLTCLSLGHVQRSSGYFANNLIDPFARERFSPALTLLVTMAEKRTWSHFLGILAP
jgi:hypothetical protein